MLIYYILNSLYVLIILISEIVIRTIQNKISANNGIPSAFGANIIILIAPANIAKKYPTTTS